MEGILIKNTFNTKEELNKAISETKQQLETIDIENATDSVRYDYLVNRLESLESFMIEFIEF